VNVQIIAEIGWNHMGDMSLAKEMISAASDSGAQYVKFQTWSVDNLKKGPWDSDGRREIYKKAELSRDQHVELFNYCNQNNISFLTSVFNYNDVEWIRDILSLQTIKIPSHEIYNVELISMVDGLFEQVFISTGAAKWKEITTITNKIKKSNLVLFHCVSAYPCPAKNINLPRILELKKLCNNVGYSGHYFGIDDAIASLNYGVNYIEKHFTIDRNLPGRDNNFAILPDELATLVEYCRNHELMNRVLGVEMQSVELDTYKYYRGRWSLSK
tara:strand:+ start:3752 stop:4564 length:813 start_codon:yes stop_codon:yes gene_type:complete